MTRYTENINYKVLPILDMVHNDEDKVIELRALYYGVVVSSMHFSYQKCNKVEGGIFGYFGKCVSQISVSHQKYHWDSEKFMKFLDGLKKRESELVFVAGDAENADDCKSGLIFCSEDNDIIFGYGSLVGTTNKVGIDIEVRVCLDDYAVLELEKIGKILEEQNPL